MTFSVKLEVPKIALKLNSPQGKVIRLRGQGTGRWPAAVSVMGDLLEMAHRGEWALSPRPAVECP
jgi:hypothetical protein